jgi:serine/threonine protein kinase
VSTVGAVIAERYEVVRVIGTGSNGAVCEVLDRKTGEHAALKMLVGEVDDFPVEPGASRSALGADADLAARLEREGKALGMLAHPNIVELVDAGTANGSPYVVTELIRGVPLRDVLERGAMPPRRALNIVRQLLEALHHVHGAGMIHRDLKPENIMLADGDVVKLLDFGIAKLLDPESDALGAEKLTRAGFEVLGSPPYIAPETAIGEEITFRTDIYSVGIILYEMLSGRPPFEHADLRTILRMHVTNPVPPLRVAVPDSTPPPLLDAIVMRALAKNSSERFGAAMDMLAAVRDAASAPPQRAAQNASSHSMPQVESRGDKAKRITKQVVAYVRVRPALAAAIGTAFVVLVVAIVVLASSGDSSGAKSATAATATTSPSATSTKVPDANVAKTFVDAGESELGRKRYARAVVAFERALAADRKLVTDEKLKKSLVKIATGADAVAAVVALDMLAKLDPPDRQTILDQASTGKLGDVRRRAFAIAERDGFAQSIDRLASWTLDLKQQYASCADRRETITKLRELGDASAVDALQRATKLYPCVAKDAAAAITHLQTPK